MDAEAWTSLAAFAGANVAAAASGGVFKPGAWYASLNRPTWTPPNWAFPLVWLVMFSLNAAAGWLVWRAHGPDTAGALAVYGGSLVLNAAWSWLFFGRRRMDLALVDVGLLWLSIAAVIALFWPLRPLAAVLLLPYLGWVTIAAVLNLRMIQLNPEG
ncbi:TspO/MBR family protein [Brevundimonas sp.]|uniref:TspO/MBR family protein n=1 Tax=Brevundimonas sp. TaxID=1871086 RepID=UPI002E0F1A75|nr:TspO/MBR family protein [Brevundimonas sp.]